MKLPISERLLACCDFVSKGDRVADIGCDHGYLGIHLLTNCIASHMIESDVAPGPLESARRNAKKYGVESAMTFCLSDGVKDIPRDFDTLVCAGMGGDTMVHILSAAPWLRDKRYRMVLQCQSKTPMLRRYLSENGWRITEEQVLKEGKFLYTVMEVYFEPEYPRLNVGECYFPPALLENPSDMVPAYFAWVKKGLEITLAHQSDEEKQSALDYLNALAADPNLSFLTEV